MERTRPKKVKEAMSTNVITAAPDTSIREVARLLTEHHIRSVPVVDPDLKVVGIITESDLFLKEKGMPFSAVKLPALFERWVDPAQLSEIYENAVHHTAADVMTEDVICVTPEDTLEHTAWLMFRQDIKTMPVVENERLVGILARSDFIRILANQE